MLFTRFDICYDVGIISTFQSNPKLTHWIAIKHILKFLRRINDYILVYPSANLMLVCYTDSDFQSDRDSRKSASKYLFTMGDKAICYISIE